MSIMCYVSITMETERHTYSMEVRGGWAEPKGTGVGVLQGCDACGKADAAVLLVTVSPGKLLDVDDQYYQQLSSSRPQTCVPPETPTLDVTFEDGQRSAGVRVREPEASEAESQRKDNRHVQQHLNQSASRFPLNPRIHRFNLRIPAIV